MRDIRFTGKASCGLEKLYTIDGVSHAGVVGSEKIGCGFYKPDYEKMSVTNTTTQQGWKIVFNRKFVEFGLQVIKRGATLKFRGGYNVFDTVNSQSRSASGYQDKVFEVQLSEEATVDSAYSLVSSAGLAALAVLLLSF